MHTQLYIIHSSKFSIPTILTRKQNLKPYASDSNFTRQPLTILTKINKINTTPKMSLQEGNSARVLMTMILTLVFFNDVV
jgi:hypothetical protein